MAAASPKRTTSRAVLPTPDSRCVQNRLLGALGETEYAELRRSLQAVPLRKHQILQEPNRPMTHAFFIEEGAASILARTRRDGPVEVGVVGRFGCVGVPLLLGTMRSPHRSVVRIPGRALRIRAADLIDARQRLPILQRVSGQYIQARLVQHSQVSLCNARHKISERLCRWLLLVHDRIEGDDIPVTHDLLSQALGVRRAGVTTAFAGLEAKGAVERGRGSVRIRSPESLEACACECYRIIHNEYEFILSAGADSDLRAPAGPAGHATGRRRTRQKSPAGS